MKFLSMRFVNDVRFWGIVITLIFIGACAKELTQEQLSREEAVRSYQRLSKAQGFFRGFAEIGKGTIPVELTVTVQGNPTAGDKNPELQSSMRIGLFGGVVLRSKGAAFDWGSSELTLSFGQTGGGGEKGSASGLELKGFISDAGMENAYLTGPKQGSHALTLNKVTEVTREPAAESFYAMMDTARENELSPHALLSIKKNPIDIVAPEGFDMPYWPGLDVSIRFPYLAQTPQGTSQVLYDPLAGTLTLNLTTETRLEIVDVVTSKEDPVGTLPSILTGVLSLSGVTQTNFILTARNLSNLPSMPLLPPLKYSGTFDSGPDTPSFRAVAYLKASGGKITNGLDMPFSTFPELRFTFYVCDKDTSLGKKELRLLTLDPLKRKLLFTVSSTGFKNDMELDFNRDWSTLQGIFISHKSTTEPRILLNADPTLGADGCKE